MIDGVIDLDTARLHLQAWVAADLALATGKKYRVGTRELTRNDAAEVLKMIAYWRGIVNNLSGKGAIRARRVVVLDT